MDADNASAGLHHIVARIEALEAASAAPAVNPVPPNLADVHDGVGATNGTQAANPLMQTPEFTAHEPCSILDQADLLAAIEGLAADATLSTDRLAQLELDAAAQRGSLSSLAERIDRLQESVPGLSGMRANVEVKPAESSDKAFVLHAHAGTEPAGEAPLAAWSGPDHELGAALHALLSSGDGAAWLSALVAAQVEQQVETQLKARLEPLLQERLSAELGQCRVQPVTIVGQPGSVCMRQQSDAASCVQAAGTQLSALPSSSNHRESQSSHVGAAGKAVDAATASNTGCMRPEGVSAQNQSGSPVACSKDSPGKAEAFTSEVGAADLVQHGTQSQDANRQHDPEAQSVASNNTGNIMLPPLPLLLPSGLPGGMPTRACSSSSDDQLERQLGALHTVVQLTTLRDGLDTLAAQVKSQQTLLAEQATVLAEAHASAAASFVTLIPLSSQVAELRETISAWPAVLGQLQLEIGTLSRQLAQVNEGAADVGELAELRRELTGTLDVAVARLDATSAQAADAAGEISALAGRVDELAAAAAAKEVAGAAVATAATAEQEARLRDQIDTMAALLTELGAARAEHDHAAAELRAALDLGLAAARAEAAAGLDAAAKNLDMQMCTTVDALRAEAAAALEPVKARTEAVMTALTEHETAIDRRATVAALAGVAATVTGLPAAFDALSTRVEELSQAARASEGGLAAAQERAIVHGDILAVLQHGAAELATRVEERCNAAVTDAAAMVAADLETLRRGLAQHAEDTERVRSVVSGYIPIYVPIYVPSDASPYGCSRATMHTTMCNRALNLNCVLLLLPCSAGWSYVSSWSSDACHQSSLGQSFRPGTQCMVPGARCRRCLLMLLQVARAAHLLPLQVVLLQAVVCWLHRPLCLLHVQLYPRSCLPPRPTPHPSRPLIPSWSLQQARQLLAVLPAHAPWLE